jgi:hypothetical protein
MSKIIQIRNVPDALHCRLKSRAALAGMSLSDYLLAEICRVADRETIGELRVRFRRGRSRAVFDDRPPRARAGASAVEALIEERREGR